MGTLVDGVANKTEWLREAKKEIDQLKRERDELKGEVAEALSLTPPGSGRLCDFVKRIAEERNDALAKLAASEAKLHQIAFEIGDRTRDPLEGVSILMAESAAEHEQLPLARKRVTELEKQLAKAEAAVAAHRDFVLGLHYDEDGHLDVWPSQPRWAKIVGDKNTALGIGWHSPAEFEALEKRFSNLLSDAEKETNRLRRIHVEDMRVTNESADFHIKECAKLRQRITDAEAETLEKMKAVIPALVARHHIQGKPKREEWLNEEAFQNALTAYEIAEKAASHARTHFPKLFDV